MIEKTYPHGKAKALNMTYDDGVLQDKKLLKLLDQYGIKATFNLNSNLMKQTFAWQHACGQWIQRLSLEEAQTLYEGHEIASHSLNHPYMHVLSPQQMLYEMFLDKDVLEDTFHRKVQGFAVPFEYDSPLLEECAKIAGFEYVRISEFSGSYTPQTDWYHWKSGIFHMSEELETFVDGFLETKENLALCQIVGHSYDYDVSDQWERIEAIFKKLSHQEDIWYATHMELVSYLKAMSKAKIEGDQIENRSSQTLWFNVHGKIIKILPNERYNGGNYGRSGKEA